MGSMQALNVLFVLAHERLLHVNTEHIHHQSSAFLLLIGGILKCVGLILVYFQKSPF